MNQDPGRQYEKQPTMIEDFFEWCQLLLDGQIDGIEQTEAWKRHRQVNAQPAGSAERFMSLYGLGEVGMKEVRVSYRQHVQGRADVSTNVRWWYMQPDVRLFQPDDPNQPVFGIVITGGFASLYRPTDMNDPAELQAMIQAGKPLPPDLSRQYSGIPQLVVSPNLEESIPASEEAVSRAIAALQDPDEAKRPLVSRCIDYDDALEQLSESAAGAVMDTLVPAANTWAVKNGVQTFIAYERELRDPNQDDDN